MKRKYNKCICFLLVAFLFGSYVNVYAQDSSKKELVLNIGYYMNNNKVVYLLVHTKAKINGRFQPIPNEVVSLYLDSVAATNFIGKVTTDDKGIAKLILSPALKSVWDASSVHTFLGITESSKDFEKATSEASITKSKVTIDTASDGKAKSIIVKVSAFKNNEWIPAKSVEMKVGINRLGGILSAGDEATYTTDSTGSVTVPLKKEGLTGDVKGNIVLVAKVEDNDQYGNLLVEKVVPWGAALQPEKNFFDQRTLWSTRFRTPIWLLVMAYFIVGIVWGTIIYLIVQIIKIKKLGAAPNIAMHEQHTHGVIADQKVI